MRHTIASSVFICVHPWLNIFWHRAQVRVLTPRLGFCNIEKSNQNLFHVTKLRAFRAPATPLVLSPHRVSGSDFAQAERVLKLSPRKVSQNHLRPKLQTFIGARFTARILSEPHSQNTSIRLSKNTRPSFGPSRVYLIWWPSFSNKF